jgi:hypothetical protein
MGRESIREQGEYRINARNRQSSRFPHQKPEFVAVKASIAQRIEAPGQSLQRGRNEGYETSRLPRRPGDRREGGTRRVAEPMFAHRPS